MAISAAEHWPARTASATFASRGLGTCRSISSSATDRPLAHEFASARERTRLRFAAATGPGRRRFGTRGTRESQLVVVDVSGAPLPPDSGGNESVVRREGGKDEDAFYAKAC